MSGNDADAEAVFFAALERTAPRERAAYAEGACAGKPELLRRVLELLAGHEESRGPLDAPPAGLGVTVSLPPITERPGTRIGPYRLLQQIGEGGMGVVYMAEQDEPVRRKVALKIIKPGMDSAQVVARFEAERQALAVMDHQNVARVFDAGTTDTGRPYFVMELVHGIPITKFCDDRQLTTRERLALFVPVCQAIQHAHTKGIIHRDVKPSNVLVTMYDDKPVPKVIDFGVAKAIEQRLTERTLFTQFGALVGTFEYMSPEQAEMNALGVDTRSDVFSLGVLLYELLTGTTPLDRERLRTAALDELVRLIKEEEPPRPSVRLSSSDTLPRIAAARKTDAAHLSKLVRGEIDWIVMKCLEKDRTRRYETASALAADVERFLADEPVQAGPPGTAYRLRKFVRRNRGPVLAAALVLLALVAGVVGTTLGLVEALHQRDETEQARRDAVRSAVTASEEKASATAARDAAERSADEELAARRRAEKAEGDARRLAEQEKDAREDMRRLLFDANMNGGYRAWQEGNFHRVLELVAETKSQPKGRDLRGFEWFFLDHLSNAELMDLPVDGIAHGCAFSPDGKLLAAVGDEAIVVWDAESGREVHRLAIRRRAWPAIAFHPDGRAIAFVDFQLGKMIDAVSCIVRIIDLESGEELRQIAVETEPGQGLSFSPDGKRLVSGPHVFDAATGNKLATLKGHVAPVSAIAFSLDGTRIVSGSEHLSFQPGRPSTGDVKVWDADTFQELLTIKDTGAVASLAIHPDGRRIAADLQTGGRHHVQLWDARTGKELQTITVYASQMAFSPCGPWLATGGNYEVLIWDLATGKLARSFAPHLAHVLGVAFSPDGRRLASSHRYGRVKVWDLGAMLQFGEPLPNNGGTTMYSLALSPDGTRLVRASGVQQHPGWVRLLDVRTGRQVWELKLGAKETVTDVAFHPDGDRIALNGALVRVVNAEDGKELFTIEARGTNSVVFSPDGHILAGANQDGTVRLWETASGGERFVFRGHTRAVLAVAFSPDGSKVLSASDDVIVWETATGKELLRFKESRYGSPRSVAFSPDGKHIATPRGVRDAVTGAVRFELKTDFHYAVQNLAFSPDGRRLVTDGQIMLIDVTNGQTVGRLKRREESPADMVVFSRDGQRLAAVNEDGTVQVWDTTPLPAKAP
jgi:WD40 repeat protein/serine/threonine protein kinase